MEHTELSIGDTIQLGSRALRVIGIIDTPITINNEGFTNGVQLIVNEEIYCSLMQDDTYLLKVYWMICAANIRVLTGFLTSKAAMKWQRVLNKSKCFAGY